MADRTRRRKNQRLRKPFTGFFNPYPNMSAPEAMVKLALEELRVPFSWRFFDGVSPTTTELIPDFAPEFTLREYSTVIIVLTSFFGTLPGILDRSGLAQATLENDGWKVVILWDSELSTKGAAQIITEKAPWLLSHTFTGVERPNPYNPNLMAKYRERLMQLNFARSKPKLKEGGVRDSRNQRRRIRIDARRGVRVGHAGD